MFAGYSHEVKRLLAKESPLNFEGCKFLQLYFNQLFEVRQALYLTSVSVSPTMNSVVDEAVRTIRISTVIISKNKRIKEIFDSTVREALIGKTEDGEQGRFENMNEAEIDSIMTLIPEAQFESIAIGTPCMDRDGKRFTVLGHVDYASLYKSSNL